LKIVSVVGARPQFIKAAPVSKALRKAGHQEILVHTGQHYDYGMAKVFFEELSISEPDVNLGVGSGAHGWQTGQMLIRIEKVLLAEKPDCVLVYGDTNSTLAGALATVKLHIPLAHVEAGLRSFNRKMPEEHNRVLTDHCADILFCPTETAVNNLRNEGFTNIINGGKLFGEIFFKNNLSALPAPWNPKAIPLGSFELAPIVMNVGDTMYDAALQFSGIARRKSTILDDLGIKSKEYLLATVHRPYNTDIPENLQNILSAFLEINEPIIFPVHPRTRQCLINSTFKTQNLKLRCIPPVGYLDMLILEQNEKAIFTDSGGMQKEAYFFGVLCVTMRTETEWVETVEEGWNVVTGANREKIVAEVRCFKTDNPRPELYGNGRATEKIVHHLTVTQIK